MILFLNAKKLNLLTGHHFQCHYFKRSLKKSFDIKKSPPYSLPLNQPVPLALFPSTPPFFFKGRCLARGGWVWEVALATGRMIGERLRTSSKLTTLVFQWVPAQEGLRKGFYFKVL
ncbi:hypothetical protein AN641_05640 [Candidatus Epulonipiscioides gigas]|nr:hypothetical protein AN641_07760 [Epulopiscium sp. SCG-C07WGA-EpuloA2]ONI44837.1 hypothetical protein AN641_05640 [Epulopiscium sp. SCG-C07WGA-EpuloA2]